MTDLRASRVAFASLDWQPGGHPLERKKTVPGSALVLLRFEAGFADPNLCRRGHAGFVFEGELVLDLEDGAELRVGAGEGFLVPAGTVHQARNAGAVPVELFIYSFES